MNERIKQLWEQAAKSTAAYPSGRDNSWETQVNFMDKFAELIVQECIAKVEMRKKFAIEDEHIVDHAFDLLVYDLESHFGVDNA